MPPLTFHDVALQPVLFGLKNARAFISKAHDHTQTAGIDPTVYLSARLHPNMLDFTTQVCLFTHHAAIIPTHLNPGYKKLELREEETGFSGLLERIEKVISYLESIEAVTLEGREDEEVELKLRKVKLEVAYGGSEYVMEYAHPNFWFHLTTAYNILRMKGMEVGKLDFLNGTGLRTFKVLG
ncbi:hypothetical protein P153DRAFT_368801 [Dothidotthia symphoricarpi CBS 119687]|uniref:Uncharacterized protein n=1 Tax=Dothidotthia symphoricarpi CBS 119687 TaxID=1392245 RepID=A0A6A6A4C8_9PLEO|nr:uncharacterized protein P153DRAFT_368801 [Dothidotthia symphoricarpi CBS 119687]KAF2126749.1 hypothetical protein P153DRAFT_368801 [Dothidotthia symphoricarpi CBS 119687]